MEPPSGVLRDDPGADHMVLAVILVKLIKPAKAGQLEAVCLQARVLHDKLVDLFLKPAVVVQRRLELLPVTEVIVERFSDPVYAGLNRHKKVADRSPERRKPFVAHRRHADHDNAENAQHCKDQPVVR